MVYGKHLGACWRDLCRKFPADVDKSLEVLQKHFLEGYC